MEYRKSGAMSDGKELKLSVQRDRIFTPSLCLAAHLLHGLHVQKMIFQTREPLMRRWKAATRLLLSSFRNCSGSSVIDCQQAQTSRLAQKAQLRHVAAPQLGTTDFQSWAGSRRTPAATKPPSHQRSRILWTPTSGIIPIAADG